jgi:flavin-dependent dehydrogenase
VGTEDLETCRRDVQKKFGLDFEKWLYFTGRVPTGSARNPRLFQDGYILAGTLSGAMDPGALFGIHGAILSGKVAATAVDNPDLAINEFKDLTRFYRISFYLRRFFSRVRGGLAMMDFNVRHPLFSYPMMLLTSGSVPGFRRGMWNYRMIKSAERIE